MRVISYDIGIDKITPQGQQYGGIQGEHKATKICVTLNSELKSKLQSEASGCDINVRIDAEDSAGTYYAGQVTSINPSNETVTINYDIEQFLTSAGIANLRLVISEAKDNKPEKILYSYPMILKFDASFDGEEAQKKIAEDITPAVAQAVAAASTAQTAASAAQAAADSVDGNAVKFSAVQELSDEQKAVARNNIGAINSTKSTNIADAEIMLHAVKFSAPQLLSDEEKSQARNNIGAVAASKVKSSLSANDDIPNAEALVKHLSENAVQFSFGQSLSDAQKSIARKNIGAVAVDNVVLKSTDKPDTNASELIYSITGVQRFLYKNTVLSTIDQAASEVANWTDTKKAQARKNIDVDGGKWVLLRTYTTDGFNKAFGDGTTSNVATTTTDGDGNALSLSAVSVVFKNTAAAAANSFVTCFAYCNAADESILAGYSIATNAINAKADAQGAAMVMSERGYYRSLSVNGAANSSVNLCENPSRVFSAVSSNTIKRIKITLGAIPPADDIIEIWGIKA